MKALVVVVIVVAVVLLLAFVNLTVTPKVWWFYWVALGWGIGVAFHFWCAFGKRRRRAAVSSSTAQQPAQRIETKAEAPKPKSPRRRAPRERKPKT